MYFLVRNLLLASSQNNTKLSYELDYNNVRFLFIKLMKRFEHLIHVKGIRPPKRKFVSFTHSYFCIKIVQINNMWKILKILAAPDTHFCPPIIVFLYRRINRNSLIKHVSYKPWPKKKKRRKKTRTIHQSRLHRRKPLRIFGQTNNWRRWK